MLVGGSGFGPAATARQAPGVTMQAACTTPGVGWSATLTVANGSADEGIDIDVVTVSGAPDDSFAPVVAGAFVAPGSQLEGTLTDISVELGEVEVDYVLVSPAFGTFQGVARATVPSGCATRSTTTTVVQPSVPATSVPATSVPVTSGPATSVPATSAGPPIGPTTTEAVILPTVSTTLPPLPQTGPGDDDPPEAADPGDEPPGDSGAEPDSGDDVTSTVAAGVDDDPAAGALLRFQPSGSMTVGQTYPVEAQAYFAGSTPDAPLVPFDPDAPTTVVPLDGVRCRVSAVLVFREGDFDVPRNLPRTINLCDGRDAAVWTWLVTPLRAATLKLTVVLTSAETGDELRSTFADIAVAAELAEPSLATAARAVPVAEVAGIGGDGSDGEGGGGFPVVPVALVGALGTALVGGWQVRSRRGVPAPLRPLVPVAPSAGATPHRVFLSYSRHDTAFLDRLDTDLQAHGFDTWRDTDDIEGGEEWRSTIAEALDAATSVVLLVSPASAVSVNVAREIALADECKKPILPVLVADGAELSGSLRYTLAATQIVDLRGVRYPEGFAELLRALAPDRAGGSPA